MPVMSSLERLFCSSSLWRATGTISASWLPADELGDHVLEIGAGSGAVAEHLLTMHPNLKITIIDIDPKMVDSAARRLRRFPHATVQLADATALPFADAAFDAVICCLMLHHVLAWEQCLEEVSRVLRRGGRFVGYDLVRTRLTAAVHTLDRSPHRLVTAAELTAACEQLGLSIDVHTRLVGQMMTFTATAEH